MDKRKEILKLLEQDSRISINAICKKLNMSRTSVYTLINSLKKEGVIKRFTIERGDIDNCGKLKVYFVLKYDTANAERFFQEILSVDGLEFCELLFGEFEVMLTFFLDNLASLDNVRVELHKLQGIKIIHTLIMHRQITIENLSSMRKQKI